MKSCPTCNRSYTDASLNFCLEDGTPLVNAPAPGYDPNATIRYGEARDTSPPPDYSSVPRPQVTPVSQGVPPTTPQWQPVPPPPITSPAPVPRKKSSAVWWVLAGLLVLGIIGVGVVIMIIALASMGTNTNVNTNRANTNRNVNRNANANVNNTNTSTNTNVNGTLPSSLTDDFSEEKWGTGTYAFGDLWYADDQYHMRSKEGKYLVMYAPTNDYSTANANVRVTVRSVDGTAPSSGFGLVVHGERKDGNLEDFALLIFNGDEPKYEIIKHKAGKQTEEVAWTDSSTIRTGSSTNQLEVRARGSELTFYINGQYVNRIRDRENFKGGLAGFYTSGTADVTFDDLEIER
jgi:hypothetical protein